jgi:hypothetical protein
VLRGDPQRSQLLDASLLLGVQVERVVDVVALRHGSLDLVGPAHDRDPAEPLSGFGDIR